VFRVTAGDGKPLTKPVTIPELAPGAEVSGSLKFRIPAKAMPGEYLVTGDVSRASGETNTANNSQTVKLTVK